MESDHNPANTDDAPVLWVARTRLAGLTDEGREALRRYAEIVTALLPRHPFATLSRAPGAQVLEGECSYDHHFIHRFPSRAAALAFYHSPEYQQAIAIRAVHCETEVILLDCVDDAAGTHTAA